MLHKLNCVILMELLFYGITLCYVSCIIFCVWNYVTLGELCYLTLKQLYYANGSTVCYISRITLCYIN